MNNMIIIIYITDSIINNILHELKLRSLFDILINYRSLLSINLFNYEQVEQDRHYHY